MIWLGEKTGFRFDQAVDADVKTSIDLVVEITTSVWQTTKRFADLCIEMADARGNSFAVAELTRFMTGAFDFTKRELERQGSAHVVELMQNVDPDAVSARLALAEKEAENYHSAAAYVLDAALSPWGFFIGNVQFSDTPRPGVTIYRTVPQTSDELLTCLEPWFKQLPAGSPREAFLEALTAAKSLDGAACREACVRAAKDLPKPAATADTEPPKDGP